MKKPADHDAAVKKFLEFHQLDVKSEGWADFDMPRTMYKVGPALWIRYLSDKWENKFHLYHHQHAAGATLYMFDKASGGVATKTPDFLIGSSLALLGGFKGAGFDNGDCDTDTGGDEFAQPGAKLSASQSELYCNTLGNALVIVKGKLGQKQSVIAAVWGGWLDVTKRGIVH